MGSVAVNLSSRFEQALVYACVAHADQKRKGTAIPYIAHLLSVAALALEYGANEDETIAALLHDAVEDAGGRPRLDDIRSTFGDDVADIVDGCTDADVIPKPPWRERKEKYIAHLAQASPSILLVSCCDKLHNARSIVTDLRELGEALWERFNGGKDGTLWYYRALADDFRKHNAPRRLVDELDRSVAVMELHHL
jgi:(p)ppGpp synthase/HD superfamily hydrolase